MSKSKYTMAGLTRQIMIEGIDREISSIHSFLNKYYHMIMASHEGEVRKEDIQQYAIESAMDDSPILFAAEFRKNFEKCNLLEKLSAEYPETDDPDFKKWKKIFRILKEYFEEQFAAYFKNLVAEGMKPEVQQKYVSEYGDFYKSIQTT